MMIATPGSPEWEHRLQEAVEDSTSPIQLWWLSFTDPSLPTGQQFLGVSIIEARNAVAANYIAHQKGCNPGGEVAAWPLPPIAEKECRPHLHTLMTREQLIEYGLSTGETLADLDDEQ